MTAHPLNLARTLSGLPLRIAITGEKHHGKDSVMQAILSCYNNIEIVRFADGLKDMLRAFYRLYGLNESEIERRIEGGLKEVPCPMLGGRTPRHAMQTLGTEWRLTIFEGLWVGLTEYRIASAGEDVATVTPDLRFPVEDEPLDDLGVFKIRVVRPDLEKTEEGATHASETSMSEIEVHVTIINDGTIADLEHKVRNVLTVCMHKGFQPVEGWTV